MTHNTTPENPQDWLARLEALPLPLSSGRSLQDFLTRDTSLGRDGAEEALHEYRRFLALALAAPGHSRMPGPMIAQLWQLHRDDSAAYAAFFAALGPGAALATRRIRWDSARQGTTASQAYAETRSAYETAFGPAPRRWWPRRAKPQGRARFYYDIAWQAVVIPVLALLYGMNETALGRGLLLLIVALGLSLTLWREAREPSAFRIYGPAAVLVTS